MRDIKIVEGLKRLSNPDNPKFIHNVVTPYEISDKILSATKVKAGKRILVIYDIATALDLHKIRGLSNFYYFDDAGDIMKRHLIKEANGIYVSSFEELEGMKFDIIVGNPPFKGTSQLHQQFFNFSVDLLKEGGVVCFLQPGTAYTNKKGSQSHEKLMIENVTKYKTKVTLFEPNMFKHVGINNKISITTLTKELADNPLDITGMNSYDFDELFFKNFTSKIKSIVETNGSLDSIVHPENLGEANGILPLSKVRPIRNADKASLFSNKVSPSNEYGKHDFGIKCTKKEAKSVESYLKCRITRSCLALLKSNANNHRGELKLIPMVKFDRIWTDKDLKKEFGITDAEYKEICRIMPEYYV